MVRWNWKKQDYEPYRVPSSWNVKLICDDMDEIVNCPHCGGELKFGVGYTSLELHDEAGFGYTVCGPCYREEIERELNAENSGT